MACKTLLKQHLKLLVLYYMFCDVGPICGQIGPILSKALGRLMKVLLWIGPNSKNRT